MEDAIVILGFLGCAALLFFMIGKIFKIAAPMRFPSESASETLCRVVTEDNAFLQVFRKYADPVTCRFYSGSRKEILEQWEKEMPDMTVLYDGGNVPKKENLCHKRVQYYASSLVSDEGGLSVYPLHYHSRKIDIYYKQEMIPVITRMEQDGVLADVPEDTA